MKNLLKLVRSLRPDLSILFLISLTSVCLIDFWFINIPQLFKGGAAIGTIVEKLCMSYISAFIFYFLIVHTKQQKDKENIYLYVSDKVWHVVAYGITPIREMAKASKVTLGTEYPTDKELLEICSRIDPHTEAPLLMNFRRNANWMEYFEYYRRQSEEAIQDIYTKMPFLDSKLIRHLSAIEETQWTTFIKAVTPMQLPYTNKNLLNFYTTLKEHIHLVKSLHDYYKTKLLPYHDKPWGNKAVIK